MDKLQIQLLVLKRFLKLKKFTSGISKNDVSIFSSYLTTEFTEQEIGKKYNVPLRNVRKICSSARKIVMINLRSEIKKEILFEKYVRERIISQKSREKEQAEWLVQVKLKQAQATKKNPDVKKLGLDPRIVNILSAGGIVLLKDLTLITEEGFCKFRGIAQKTLEEVKEKLKEFNLSFKKG